MLEMLEMNMQQLERLFPRMYHRLLSEFKRKKIDIVFILEQFKREVEIPLSSKNLDPTSRKGYEKVNRFMEGMIGELKKSGTMEHEELREFLRGFAIEATAEAESMDGDAAYIAMNDSGVTFNPGASRFAELNSYIIECMNRIPKTAVARVRKKEATNA